VVRGHHRQSGERVAVKVMVRRAASPGISLAEQVNPEVHVMKRIQSVGFGAHPNLIGFKGHWRHESPAPEDPEMSPRAVASFVDYLVLEAAEGGDLFARVRSRGALPEPEAREHFLQLALGLHALHACHVAHLDVKLENAVIGENGGVKLIDFGNSFAYDVDDDGAPQPQDGEHPRLGIRGSRSYLAPEVLKGSHYDGLKADVWSLGVTLYAMLASGFPWYQAAETDARFARLSAKQRAGGSISSEVALAQEISPEAIAVLDMALQVDPDKRATLQEILSSDWLLGADLGSHIGDVCNSLSPTPQPDEAGLSALRVPTVRSSSEMVVGYSPEAANATLNLFAGGEGLSALAPSSTAEGAPMVE
jgi:serine/threonine protein kinase